MPPGFCLARADRGGAKPVAGEEAEAIWNIWNSLGTRHPMQIRGR